jgi:heat-inducible transcriptional repressor
MASLILVLREGAIKQAVVALDEADAVDQPTLNRVASLLNEQLTDSSATRAEAILARLTDDEPLQRLARHVGGRIVRILRDYDAASVEEVFSDGLLNVMEAPEFAQSDKLRQVFSALENRAYLGELVGSVAGSGTIHILIGAENARAEMHDVSLVLAPYGRPGQAIGVVGVLGPTRMSYSHAIGTVRFVSGLMNELVDHLYA